MPTKIVPSTRPGKKTKKLGPCNHLASKKRKKTETTKIVEVMM
jgi:hypothetical protein